MNRRRLSRGPAETLARASAMAMASIGLSAVAQQPKDATAPPAAQTLPAAQPVRTLPVRTLLDRSLHATTVRLVGITHGRVMFLGTEDAPSAAPRTIEAFSLLAIVAEPDQSRTRTRRSPLLATEPNAPPPVRVVLTDGQRLIGRVAEPRSAQSTPTGASANKPAAGENQSLVLEISALGSTPIAVALEQIARLETLVDTALGNSASDDASLAHPANAPQDDSVVLLNGDAVHGFVESLGAEVVVQGKSGEPPARFPLARVARIVMANPPTPPSGPRVWLSDGSVIALASGAVDSEDFLSAAGRLGGALHAKPNEVTGLVMDAGLLTPLSECAVAEYHAAPERAWTRPPRTVRGDGPLNAGNIELPGPMTVEWTLPPSAARLSGSVELARSTERWGDCVVVIEDAAAGAPPKRLFNQRLTADAPSAAFDVALSSAVARPDHRLRVMVQAGENGPILDRVVLVRPMLLLEAAGKGRPVPK